MPILQWNGKQLKTPEPATLTLDSVTYPRTSDWGQSPSDNKLILGDNLAIMAGLLPEYEGRLDLIYVDPPFFTVLYVYSIEFLRFLCFFSCITDHSYTLANRILVQKEQQCLAI